jgi:plasmid stabilization system protein ParE
MALEIIWSEEADDNLATILNYLLKHWTEKELKTFAKKLDDKINLISKYPLSSKQSHRLQGTRECIITKHNTLFYVVDNTSIYIVSVWDNRQNPDKLKRK